MGLGRMNAWDIVDNTRDDLDSVMRSRKDLRESIDTRLGRIEGGTSKDLRDG